MHVSAGLQDSGESALTGNDRDCRISSYWRYLRFPVFKERLLASRRQSRLRQTLSLRIYLVERRSFDSLPLLSLFLNVL